MFGIARMEVEKHESCVSRHRMLFNIAEVQVSEFIRMDVLRLRPTQFAVGMRQVKTNQKKLSRWSAGRIRKLIQHRPIPTVIGPGKLLYIVDRHHLASALHGIGERMAWIEIKANWSNLSQDAFWMKMRKNNWVHLYDCQGKGPRSCKALPKSVAELRDDPYRSLAWAVRKKGAYFKSSQPFSDFFWANFFRERVELGPTVSFKKATKKACKLADSDEAQGLPGFVRFE